MCKTNWRKSQKSLHHIVHVYKYISHCLAEFFKGAMQMFSYKHKYITLSQQNHIITSCIGNIAPFCSVWTGDRLYHKEGSTILCCAAGSSCHKQNSWGATESCFHYQAYENHSLHKCDSSNTEKSKVYYSKQVRETKSKHGPNCRESGITPIPFLLAKQGSNLQS